MRDLPAGTVTFLFTDVEGSTKLLHELGAEAYAAALAEHRRLIREACAVEGGVEVDTQGDAFFFAFPTAPGALAAAAAFTEALASGPIAVRVGLHTGTPLLADEGYVGDDVHFAARVGSSSHGGQVVLSRATRALLDERFPLTDLGEHRLKDVAEPVQIFQLGEGAFPPLKTISNTNLPRPASSFVGREAELAEVISRLEGGARLLTLTGPGGSGKTRLALEAATSLVPSYKAGAFWVGLASLRDPALVSETIAQTLGAKDGLAEHVGERELLLLLDNLEQVVEAAPALASLLEACPHLTLLCTSRELLRVRGEVEYPVPPLAEREAVELFCARSQLGPSEEIAELCARLDNLPLAVELAAARTKALTPAQILERLSQRLDLLKGGRDADPRQQTLRAAIEWSYDLLTPGEQALFARLSVFAGGCTLEAAEEVAGADLDTLQSLVEKSLLRSGDGRYWMLETIREYAGERLLQSGKHETIRAHASWFREFAIRAGLALRGADQGEWFEKLDHEIENLRAAIERSKGSLAELEVLASLGDFWDMHGYAREARARLADALCRHPQKSEARADALRVAAELAITFGETGKSRALSEEALALARGLGLDVLAARCLNNLGIAALYESDLVAAAEMFAESARVRENEGDVAGCLRARANLATVLVQQGDLVRAEQIFAEAIPGFEALGDEWSVANSNAGLGDVAKARGDLRAAAHHYATTLAVFARMGTLEPTAEILERLASVRAREDPHRAGVMLGAAEALREEIDVRGYIGQHEVRADAEERVRDQIGLDGAHAAHAKGRSMDLAEAVEYALASIH